MCRLPFVSISLDSPPQRLISTCLDTCLPLPPPSFGVTPAAAFLPLRPFVFLRGPFHLLGLSLLFFGMWLTPVFVSYSWTSPCLPSRSFFASSFLPIRWCSNSRLGFLFVSLPCFLLPLFPPASPFRQTVFFATSCSPVF